MATVGVVSDARFVVFYMFRCLSAIAGIFPSITDSIMIFAATPMRSARLVTFPAMDLDF